MSKSKTKDRAKIFKEKKNSAERWKRSNLSKIVKWDNPILKKECEIVTDYEQAKEIIKEMKQVLSYTETGVGLASSQIGYDKKIIIYKNIDENGSVSLKEMINPVVDAVSEETLSFEEGCLSYPGVFVETVRPKKITVTYESIYGVKYTEDYEDMYSIIISHEIDHTNGICVVGEKWKKQSPEKKEIKRIRKKIK